MVYPYVFGLLVDEVFYNKNMSFFITIIVIYAIIYFTEQLLHLILNVLWPYQFNVYLLEIREAIYIKIMNLRYATLTNMPIGDLIGKVNWEADAFVELLHRNVAYLIANTIKLVTIVGIVFLIDFRLSILLIVTIIISYIASYKLGIKIGERQKEVRDKYMSFLAWTFEMLGGIREIKLFGAEKRVSAICNNTIEFINEENEKQVKTEVFSDRICAFIILVANISLYALSGILIYKDVISLGSFVAVIAYFEVANTLLGSINKYWGKVHGNNAIIDDLVNLFELQTEEEIEKEDIEIREGKIEFNNVDFSYGNKDVLKGFNLSIESGSSVALVGKSGAGKSTVANLILRLLDSKNGTITIDGQNIEKCNLYSLREQVGIVQQEIFVFDGTIRENMLLAKKGATDEEILKALKDADLEVYMDNTEKGLDTVIGTEGISMSGGEKQRLAIARLFLRNPQILIFDEATSSLDANTEKLVNDAWKKLAKGKTAIVIAHRLSTILCADKIAIMDAGKVVGYDVHENLLKNSKEYSNLFKEQYLKDKVSVE